MFNVNDTLCFMVQLKLNFLFAEGVGLQLSTMHLCQSCGLRTAGSNCIPYKKTCSVCTCRKKPCSCGQIPSKYVIVYVYYEREAVAIL